MKPNTVTLKELLTEFKRERQYKSLLKWDHEELTGREAIEAIIAEEKMYYMPTHPEFQDYINRYQESINQKKGN